MIVAGTLLRGLVARGATLFTGVPCSYLAPLIDCAQSAPEVRYVPAAGEGEALSLAAGAWLSGSIGVVLCQNSGLGNMVNPLTSLAMTLKLPALLLITWRGRPGEHDEPQHELMGRITTKLVELMEIPWAHLPAAPDALPGALDVAFDSMRTKRIPYAFVIRRDDIAGDPGTALSNGHAGTDRAKGDPALPTRAEALAAFLSAVPDDAPVVATTGKCGRELFTLSDRRQHVYCVGSMGYASALANGIALETGRRVFVLDGDGALLMHMGNIATIGAQGADLTHVVLDNGAYDSTGAQPTISSAIDFAGVAAACGYRDAVRCGDLTAFERALRDVSRRGPRLLHLRIRPPSLEPLGRPTATPPEVAARLREFLTEVPCISPV